MTHQIDKPTISIIIPHLNGKQHLDDCLSSLRAQTYRDFEVLLVDNGSTDGSQAYVRANFPDVRLLELGQNQGFTGACNAGREAAKGEIIILLNNDTEADPNWLQEVSQAFAQRPEVGSVASKMLLFDQRDHFHTAGDFYGLMVFRAIAAFGRRMQGQYDQVEYVFGACGGAAAYRRAMLEEIGFLDDDFYFSCEDVDLAFRANLAGWRTLYAPTAVVYHKLKASGGSGVMSSYYDGRNFFYIIWKNYPRTMMRQNWRALIGAQLKISRAAIRAWRGEAARARLRGQLAGLFGFFKMRAKRKQIQAKRRLSDESLTAILTPVDETPSQR